MRQQCDAPCACTVQHELRELERQLSDQAAAAEKELSQQQAVAAADRSRTQVDLKFPLKGAECCCHNTSCLAAGIKHHELGIMFLLQQSCCLASLARSSGGA